MRKYTLVRDLIVICIKPIKIWKIFFILYYHHVMCECSFARCEYCFTLSPRISRSIVVMAVVVAADFMMMRLDMGRLVRRFVLSLAVRLSGRMRLAVGLVSRLLVGGRLTLSIKISDIIMIQTPMIVNHDYQ
jgi:hypothetical protein